MSPHKDRDGRKASWTHLTARLERVFLGFCAGDVRVEGCRDMGMFDTIQVLDSSRDLRCPHGHPIRSLQTKDLDEPSMQTYLLHGGRLYLTLPIEDGTSAVDEDAESWRVEGDTAVREHRYALREVATPRTVRVYAHCRECAPILVRTDRPSFLGDLVEEHALFVDFALTFPRNEPARVERTSGTRDELKRALSTRGVYVLEEDEPLAVAHREVKKAREVLERHSPGRHRSGW